MYFLIVSIKYYTLSLIVKKGIPVAELILWLTTNLEHCGSNPKLAVQEGVSDASFHLITPGDCLYH